MTALGELPSVFDEGMLLEISMACEIPPLELIAMFVEDCASGMGDLDVALARRDQAIVHRHLHTMKSSAASVGAARFAELAQVLESASREQLPEDFSRDVACLREELAHFQLATDARRTALSVI